MSRAATVPVPRAGTTRATGTGSPPAPSSQQGAAGVGPAAGQRTRAALCALALYLACALAAWWHLLTRGFGSAIPAGSADPGQEVWFLAWLPHALGAGTNPFFTHAVFAPAGVNLLDNTSMDLLGLLLSPVTVTAGPVASLDVAVVLAPALSALGAFALCRRYVSWAPAAFAGGLAYGFGPFIAGDLRYAHLDLTWLVLPPLILCALDALLVRGARRPLLAGATLGMLVVAQFFVSTEMLAITALTATIASVVVSVGWPRAALAHLAAAWRPLALATGVVAVALSYPLWVVVAGPRHVDGPVWRHIGTIAASLASTVEPHGQLAGVSFISGSNGSYLGPALVATLVLGAIFLWRSRTLRVLLVTALATYVLSLGYELHVGHRSLHVPLAAAVFGHVPLLDSIVPERFASMVDLFCGLALAVIVDHLRAWRRSDPRRSPATTGVGGSATASTPAPGTTPLVVALALAVAGFALVPLAAIPRWPYPVARTSNAPTPATVGSERSPTRAPVLAMFPDTSSWVSREMVWQAKDGYAFTLADGYAIVPGPGRRAVEAPPTDALWLVFAAASVHRLHLPLTRTTRAAVRADLRELGIDGVVVTGAGAGDGRNRKELAVRRALREALGPPQVAGDGTLRWSVPGAAP